MPATIVIVVVIAVAFAYGLRKSAGRYRRGCCDAGCEPAERVKAADSDKRNYPYVTALKIDGMHCERCVAAIENAFHAKPGFLAEVKLSNGTAKVYSKEPASEGELVSIVARAGYEARIIK